MNKNIHAKAQNFACLYSSSNSLHYRHAMNIIGGDEASLFASELFKMYQKYSEVRRWKWEQLSLARTEVGNDIFIHCITLVMIFLYIV